MIFLITYINKYYVNICTTLSTYHMGVSYYFHSNYLSVHPSSSETKVFYYQIFGNNPIKFFMLITKYLDA